MNIEDGHRLVLAFPPPGFVPCDHGAALWELTARMLCVAGTAVQQVRL